MQQREADQSDIRNNHQWSNKPKYYTEQSTHSEKYLKQRCNDDCSLYLWQLQICKQLNNCVYLDQLHFFLLQVNYNYSIF